LGESTESNPLAQAHATPFLREFLGGPLLSGLAQNSPQLLFKAINAQLGMPGLPQSATGQTSLYTGRNAPAWLGRHLTGFANGSLRVLIEESGIFRQVLDRGGVPTHANLYSPAYFEAIEKRRIRYSVGTLVGLTAGVPFRMPEAYLRGEAISWDITGFSLTNRGVAAPMITEQEAGQRLAHIGSQHHLTLFECYLPDFAGHTQDMAQALEVLAMVDAFLASVIAHLSPDVTLVVSSDHGNIENLASKSHTLNPVPLLVVGPQAPAFQDIIDITGLTPQIIQAL